MSVNPAVQGRGWKTFQGGITVSARAGRSQVSAPTSAEKAGWQA